MKVLHINTNYEVSSIYPNMLYELNLVTNEKGRLYYPVYQKKIIKDKNRDDVDVSKCLNKYDRLFFFKRNKKLYEDITELYSLNKFDVIFAYSLFSNGYLAYNIKKKHGIPYIVIIQNTDINLYFNKMLHLRNVGRKILHNASYIIFISEAYKEYLLKNYVAKHERSEIIKKSYVIPFGIDNFWFENKIHNKKKNKDKIKLLYVGKINRNKNILASIKACKSLIDMGQNLSFTVVGEIQNRRLAKKIMKNKFVYYVPFSEKNDLLNIYRDNDIFIMPSKKETFGLVYAEAMSQGLPVIYSKGQGFDKQFKEGTVGHRVEPNNINGIVDSILKIYEHYEDYTNRCTYAVEKFRWKNIIGKYKFILEQIK